MAFVTGPDRSAWGSPRAVPSEVEGQGLWMPTAIPWGPAQKAGEPLLPAQLPGPPWQLPVCTQPAQQEAGLGPGQLVPVTLYPTQSMLRDQKPEQGSWRRSKAFPPPARLLWVPGPERRVLGRRPPLGSVPLSQRPPHPPQSLPTKASEAHTHIHLEGQGRPGLRRMLCVTLSEPLGRACPARTLGAGRQLQAHPAWAQQRAGAVCSRAGPAPRGLAQMR